MSAKIPSNINRKMNVSAFDRVQLSRQISLSGLHHNMVIKIARLAIYTNLRFITPRPQLSYKGNSNGR